MSFSTEIVFRGELFKEKEILQQGDYVYCEGFKGAQSFWGIYSAALKCVVCLDGGGSSYVHGYPLHVGDVVSYWKIAKRILSENVKLTIEEKC